MARKYSKASQKEIEKEMRRFKKGKAHSALKSIKSKASNRNRFI